MYMYRNFNSVLLLPSQELFDYEDGPRSYDLVIEARDVVTPVMYGNTSLAITILDVNDEPPTFSSPSYSLSVSVFSYLPTYSWLSCDLLDSYLAYYIWATGYDLLWLANPPRASNYTKDLKQPHGSVYYNVV